MTEKKSKSKVKKLNNSKNNEPLITGAKRGFHTLEIVDIAHQLLTKNHYSRNRFNKIEELYTELNKYLQKDGLTFTYPKHFKVYLDELLDANTNNKRIVFSSPPQHSKAEWVENLIPTPDRGLVRAGDIRPGDFLYDEQGNPTKVIQIHPQGLKQLYKVSFNDHTSVEVCAEHNWAVKSKWRGHPEVLTTKQIMEQKLIVENNRCLFEIPVIKPIKNKHIDLPMDPYLLGLWLGDGNLRSGGITTMDPEILDYIKKFYPIITRVQGAGKANTYFFKDLNADLTKITGLPSAKRNEKRIPKEYFLSSLEQRLELFKGLMDTDGTCSLKGSQTSFTTTCDGLKEDFIYLASSLGAICRTLKQGTYIKYNGKKKNIWTVYIRLPEGFEYFKLKRKQERMPAFSNRHIPKRKIKSIEKTKIAEAVCFTVDSPNSLYCTGKEHIVTHNTSSSMIGLIYLCLHHTKKQHMYITYSSDRAKAVKREFVHYLELLKIEFEEIADEIWIKSYLKQETGDERFDNKIVFTSLGGKITGTTIDGVCLMDDLIKNAEEARSQATRIKNVEEFERSILTRGNQTFSIIAIGTRWATDDILSTMLEKGFKYIRLPAICDSEDDPNGRHIGAPLWPEGHSLESLMEVKGKISSSAWSAMYQGKPISAEQRPLKLEQLTWVLGLPTPRVSVVGIDLAYTPGRGDHSVAIKLIKADGKYFIISALREQVLFTDFVKLLNKKYDGIKILWYAGPSEYNQAGLQIKKDIPNVIVERTNANKFMRAQNLITAWEQNKFHILDTGDTKVMPKILDDIRLWDGVSHTGSDTVDALVAAFDLVERLSRHSSSKAHKGLQSWEDRPLSHLRLVNQDRSRKIR